VIFSSKESLSNELFCEACQSWFSESFTSVKFLANLKQHIVIVQNGGASSMSALFKFINSSIGSKTLMGLSGLALSGFVLVHMAGNLFIFGGPESYNTYGYKLESNPLLIIAEAGLVVFFLTHIVKGLLISLKNLCARGGQGYAVAAKGSKATTPVSKTLAYQGIIILVFLVLHLITFKYGADYRVTYNGVEMRDLYKLINEVFHKPTYVIWYVAALLVLWGHLGHGLYSTFQTLGLNHPKYECALKKIGYVYAAIVSLGFISQPLYVFLHNSN
jgi:succinate dehydrogenase / fumarate reductase cytochrome b subunit